MKEKRALFVDRDGIINETVLRNGKFVSPRTFQDFRLQKGIKQFLKKVKELGFLIIVVTNQPDIARGLMSKKELSKIHSFIKDNLPIDEIFVCPHDNDDNCSCRKPKPGMLGQATKKWGINLKKSFILGDGWRDIEAGKKAGCQTILLQKKNFKETQADFLSTSFNEILKILKNSNP